MGKSQPDDVHVTPTFGKEHAHARTCWCRPSVEIVEDGDGATYGFVVLHQLEN